MFILFELHYLMLGFRASNMTRTLLKENPLSIKYIKILKVFLSPLGAWPGEALGEYVPFPFRFHRHYVTVQSNVMLIGQVLYMSTFYETMSFFLKGHCYITMLLNMATTVRTYVNWFKKYGEITKTFLMSFHLIHYKDKGEYYKKIYILTDKLSYYFTVYMSIMMMVGMILFNLGPIYQNYKSKAFSGNRVENSTVEFAVYYTFTGYDPANKIVLVTVFNVYLTYVCAVLICCLDCFLCLIVFQIIGHIQILRNNLNRFPKPKKQIISKFSRGGKSDKEVIAESFDTEENLLVHKMLIECIDHHRMIVEFTQKISDFYGPVLGANYVFELLSICLLLFECSRADTDAIVRFGTLTFIVFGQLIQMSVVFEVVGTASEKLKNAVYFLPWECMDGKNRRTVYIMLHRVQHPIRVTAMGLTSVGVTTMAQILKTSFTYFTILNSMKD